MSQNLNTASISEFTDLVERDWTYNNGNFVETGIASQMFITENMASYTGESRRYTEIDPETFATLKDEGDDASIATVQKGYEKDMEVKRFAKEISITYEMRRYNKKPEVMAQLTSLSHFCPNRMEIDLTHRLSFMTATSYTDMDGQTVATTVGDTLALVSASHTLRASASTFSNVITGNPLFSKGGLEIAETQANTQVLSQFGERRIMDFNIIWTGDDPTTCNDVKQFLNSTADVDQENPAVTNVYQNKYRQVKLRYLATAADGAYNSAKAKYWGIAAVGQGQKGWQAYLGIWDAPSLKTPAPGNNGEDVHNDDWTYGTRCAYGIATVSARGLLGSTGVGA